MNESEDVGEIVKRGVNQEDPRKQHYFLKFVEKLKSLPPSGGGGCHQALLGIANIAVRAGVSCDDFLILCRFFVEDRKRPVSDSEIGQAYERAESDIDEKTKPAKSYSQKRNRVSHEVNSKIIQYRNTLIKQGSGTTEEDIMMASPIPPSVDPASQARQVFENLYQKEDLLFIGQRRDPGKPGYTMHRAWQMLKEIPSNVQERGEFIIPNPLRGYPADKKCGTGKSMRCDAAVEDYRFTIAEFDNLPIKDQLAFWSQIELPIAALIYSGGKSIHAWIHLENVKTAEDWDEVVKVRLYDELLIPMGVDPACRNPSRLSRMPGGTRSDNNSTQQLLYLSTDKKGVKI